MSTENERDFKTRIADMEKDLSSQEELTGEPPASVGRNYGGQRLAS